MNKGSHVSSIGASRRPSILSIAAVAFALTAFFVSAPFAHAATTWYVDAACVDVLPVPADGNCDAPNTFKTIAEAITAASSGDTISVAAGTYSGATVDKSVTIDGGDVAVINSQMTVTADDVTLSNLVFSGNIGSAEAINLDSNNARTGITISNNHFTNSITTSYVIRAGSNKTDLTITGNTFTGKHIGQ